MQLSFYTLIKSKSRIETKIKLIFYQKFWPDFRRQKKPVLLAKSDSYTPWPKKMVKLPQKKIKKKKKKKLLKSSS